MRKMSIKTQEPTLASKCCTSLRSWDEEDGYQEPILASLLHGVRSWDEKDEYQEPALASLLHKSKDKFQGQTLTSLLHNSTEPGSYGWDGELGRVLFTNLGKLAA
jgi:hypothetical protein